MRRSAANPCGPVSAGPRRGIEPTWRRSGATVVDGGDDDGVEDVPETRDLRKLRAAAARCVRCELHDIGTQTVFGEGKRGAWLMLVGEQPGDKEDIAGVPFVGPAGKLLDRALGDVGIDRAEVYLTNVVKHFRWEQRGARRLHKTPSIEHVRACTPWLDAELRSVEPDVVVLLGATAARAVMGSKFRLTTSRGQLLDSSLGVPTMATVHPSAVLRSDDRSAAFSSFRDDLATVLPLRPDMPRR
jgi:uracil-DNA glycosylase